MTKNEPLYTVSKPLIIDGISMDIIGDTFTENIYSFGDQVFNSVKIIRRDNKTAWGFGFHPEARPLSKEELTNWIEDLSESPETIKLPF